MSLDLILSLLAYRKYTQRACSSSVHLKALVYLSSKICPKVVPAVPSSFQMDAILAWLLFEARTTSSYSFTDFSIILIIISMEELQYTNWPSQSRSSNPFFFDVKTSDISYFLSLGFQKYISGYRLQRSKKNRRFKFVFNLQSSLLLQNPSQQYRNVSDILSIEYHFSFSIMIFKGKRANLVTKQNGFHCFLLLTLRINMPVYPCYLSILLHFTMQFSIQMLVITYITAMNSPQSCKAAVQFIRTQAIVQTAIKAVAVAVAGLVIQSYRDPALINHARTIASEWRNQAALEKLQQLFGLVWGYLFLGFLAAGCGVYCIWKRNVSVRWNSLFIFFFLSFAWGWMQTREMRQSYTIFYNTFLDGDLKSNNFFFKGYRQHYFSSHYASVKKVLQDTLALARDNRQIDWIKLTEQMVLKQDKALGTFRSYLSNHSLLAKLIHILYYSAGSLAFFLLFLAFCGYFCLLKPQKYAKLPHSQHLREENGWKISISILIRLVLAAGGVILFVGGDILQQMQLGRIHDGNKKQNSLCSFHKMSGGLSINLDYEPQMQLNTLLANKIPSISKQTEQSLRLYANLCQQLTPYFEKGNQIQRSGCVLCYQLSISLFVLIWLLPSPFNYPTDIM